MIVIDRNNVVTLNRGDTFRSPLFINQGNDLNPIRYTLKEGDEIYLAVMEPNQIFEEAIIRKKYNDLDLNENGDVILELRHEDTASLKPGKYYYQIKAKLLQDMQTVSTSITIMNTTSILKKGSKLSKGSIIQGKEIICDIGKQYYILENDIECNLNDLIARGSSIKSNSIINGEISQSYYNVNTLIQKTQLNLME